MVSYVESEWPRHFICQKLEMAGLTSTILDHYCNPSAKNWKPPHSCGSLSTVGPGWIRLTTVKSTILVLPEWLAKLRLQPYIGHVKLDYLVNSTFTYCSRISSDSNTAYPSPWQLAILWFSLPILAVPHFNMPFPWLENLIQSPTENFSGFLIFFLHCRVWVLLPISSS